MRYLFEQEPHLFTIPISESEFPTKVCRDESPVLLFALQQIYLNKELNRKVFEILDLCINMKTGKGSGRKGMGLWEIFVLAVMKHGLNTNYDSLHFHANNNFLLRSVMGIASYDVRKRKEYGLTTIKENVSLLDKKTIDVFVTA